MQALTAPRTKRGILKLHYVRTLAEREHTEETNGCKAIISRHYSYTSRVYSGYDCFRYTRCSWAGAYDVATGKRL